MPYWKSRGLRGGAFEELISLTNRLYEQQGLAVIQKVPTPITPVALEGGRISSAYFEKKSTVDYIGAAQGIPICFDAKETKYPYLPTRNIHTHQIEFMEAFRKQKGVSFVLVNFTARSEMFMMPVEDLAKFHERAARGGRKSIPIEEFNPDYKVPNRNGFPVHYLIAVNAYLENHRSVL